MSGEPSHDVGIERPRTNYGYPRVGRAGTLRAGTLRRDRLTWKATGR